MDMLAMAEEVMEGVTGDGPCGSDWPGSTLGFAVIDAASRWWLLSLLRLGASLIFGWVWH